MAVSHSVGVAQATYSTFMLSVLRVELPRGADHYDGGVSPVGVRPWGEGLPFRVWRLTNRSGWGYLQRSASTR